ncbi:MAG: LTA synthase family protein [Saprospiraceae bacterium]|nr:LTA synthase family protein [Saprospiraceae bacterium]
MIAIISLLYGSDAVLYREWGYRLDKTAFMYLTQFREAGNFIAPSNSIMGICLSCCFFITGWFIFQKFKSISEISTHKYLYVLHFLCIPLLILPIRGGIGIIPMNPGKVYFSTHAFSNHSALNVPWNLLYSFEKSNKTRQDIILLNSQATDEILASNILGRDTNNCSFLTLKRPKILMFLLESFTANLIYNNFEETEITPGLNRNFKTGVYFKNAYASGDRTEMGIAASLSGFPAQPFSSILHYPDKTLKLPSILTDLEFEGYHTAFYYGGDVSFANMNSYFLNAGCDRILDKSAFPSSSYNAKWGVHDHILFEKIYGDIITDTSLFFKICLSLSSHPPYDVPEKTKWESIREEVQFLNTAHYTDKHLTRMLDQLKQLPIWNELLIVIVADHGARFPGNHPFHTPEKFHIPMWFGGGVIQKDTIIQTIVSQSDLPALLLEQMGLLHHEYTFSRGLSSSCIPFAYYAFNKGYGIVDSCGTKSWSLDPHQLLLKVSSPCTPDDLGKAFTQKVLNVFESL